MKYNFYTEFIEQSIDRMDQNTRKIESCLNELDEKEIWFYPNEHLNSVGNLVLHLSGNIRQYIISSLGEIPDVRERDLEFSTRGGYLKEDLFRKLRDTVEKAEKIITNISEENLLIKRSVQGFTYSGIGNIIHVTEHYSYHTGQIILLTKFFKNMDMEFYSGVNLIQRNFS